MMMILGIELCKVELLLLLLQLVRLLLQVDGRIRRGGSPGHQLQLLLLLMGMVVVVVVIIVRDGAHLKILLHLEQ